MNKKYIIILLRDGKKRSMFLTCVMNVDLKDTGKPHLTLCLAIIYSFKFSWISKDWDSNSHVLVELYVRSWSDDKNGAWEYKDCQSSRW